MATQEVPILLAHLFAASMAFHSTGQLFSILNVRGKSHKPCRFWGCVDGGGDGCDGRGGDSDATVSLKCLVGSGPVATSVMVPGATVVLLAKRGDASTNITVGSWESSLIGTGFVAPYGKQSSTTRAAAKGDMPSLLDIMGTVFVMFSLALNVSYGSGTA